MPARTRIAGSRPTRRWIAALLVAGVAPAVVWTTAVAAPAGDDDASAQKPLDPRIDPSRITETAPPPTPNAATATPPGPQHRIAGSADNVPVRAESFEQARELIREGIDALWALQGDDGAWMSDARAVPTNRPDAPSPVAVAVTALVLKAIVQADPQSVEKPEFRRAIQYIDRARNQDGSFEGGALTNYVTSTVVSGLSAIDRDKFSTPIEDAAEWLQNSQWDEGEGLTKRQDWYGGAGYGNHGRPDLSNTQMMLEALYDAGLTPDEPAYQRALAFLARTQNLEEVNPAGWAGNDGGFVYTSANGGESMASQAAGEGRRGENMPADSRTLRSYGSMTYAGFKSLLYAGLSRDDVRVRAAYDWIRNHYTFDENPGVGQQGLYYYYHAMARALRVARQPLVKDRRNEVHNWREDLIDALAKRQRDDGAWVNEADRWMEGDPALVTAYAVLALEEAIKPVKPSAEAASDTMEQTAGAD